MESGNLNLDIIDTSEGANQMSGSKWEDLNMDCLVNVLTRVGIESLLLGAPFVCQSWCPALKALFLSYDVCDSYFPVIPELVSKWKNLELLSLGSLSNMEKVFEEINCHCKNFHWLCAFGANIGRDTASAIVTFLPNLKYLFMKNADIDRESLEMILQGCKELVRLDARGCVGYECDDQLLKLASHISNFQHEGSTLFGYEDDWEPIDHDTIYDDYLSD